MSNDVTFAIDLRSRMTKYATDHHSTTFAVATLAAAAVDILECEAVQWDLQLQFFLFLDPLLRIRTMGISAFLRNSIGISSQKSTVACPALFFTL